MSVEEKIETTGGLRGDRRLRPWTPADNCNAGDKCQSYLVSNNGKSVGRCVHETAANLDATLKSCRYKTLKGINS